MSKHVPYKYKLGYLLRRMPMEEYILACQFLPKLCGVSKRTFRNWIYRKADSNILIPGEHLIKLAKFFNLSPEELLEEPPTTAEIAEDWEEFKNQHINNLML